MKKFMILIFVIMLAASQTQAQEQITLPEISGWMNGHVRETKLDAISGNKGVWYERDYRTQSGALCHAVLMTGATFENAAVNDNVAEMKNSAGEYAEAATIDGCEAVIEFHPVLGFSLSVKIGPNTVLTVESKNADKNELINAAETIAKASRVRL